jgi:hypothetical protein
MHGSVAISADGSFIYTPADNFYGADSFSYRAGDGDATSAPAVVTIEVAPIDDPPVAQNSTYKRYRVIHSVNASNAALAACGEKG